MVFTREPLLEPLQFAPFCGRVRLRRQDAPDAPSVEVPVLVARALLTGVHLNFPTPTNPPYAGLLVFTGTRIGRSSGEPRPHFGTLKLPLRTVADVRVLAPLAGSRVILVMGPEADLDGDRLDYTAHEDGPSIRAMARVLRDDALQSTMELDMQGDGDVDVARASRHCVFPLHEHAVAHAASSFFRRPLRVTVLPWTNRLFSPDLLHLTECSPNPPPRPLDETARTPQRSGT